MPRKKLLILAIIFTVIGVVAYPQRGVSGVFEFSSGFTFSKSSYSKNDESFTWERGYRVSFGYHFSRHSGIEVGYSDTERREKIKSIQDLMYHDRSLSLNWVQTLLGRRQPIRPYFKVGGGQIIREVEGEYSDGSSPDRKVLSFTGVLSVGLKIRINHSISLNTEATSYLRSFQFDRWRDNIKMNIGTSIYF